MAINFGFVVPKEEVEKYGADFGKHPVGTGAFKFVEWTPGQKLVLERFADYHTKGVPYLDKLTFEFGQDPTVNVLRLQEGRGRHRRRRHSAGAVQRDHERPREQGPDRRSATSCTPAMSR